MRRNPLLALSAMILLAASVSALSLVLSGGRAGTPQDGPENPKPAAPGACPRMDEARDAFGADIAVPDPDRRKSPPPESAPNPESKQPLVIRGKVLDEKGSGLAGVRMVLTGSQGAEVVFTHPAQALTFYGNIDDSGTPADWPSTASISGGLFELEAPCPGIFRVIADSRFHRPAFADVKVPDASNPEALIIRLESGMSLEGFVQDVYSACGVGGIRIVARQMEKPKSGGGNHWTRIAVSENDGFFRFNGLVEGDVELSIEIPVKLTYRQIEPAVRSCAGEKNVKIDLWPLGYVEFVALHELDRMPIEGAIVVSHALNPDGGPADSSRLRPAFMPAISSADPPARVLQSLAGKYEYLFEITGYAPLSAVFTVEPGIRTVRKDPLFFSKGSWFEGSFRVDPRALKTVGEWKGVQCHVEKMGPASGLLQYREIPAGAKPPENYLFNGFADGPHIVTVLSPGFEPLQKEISLDIGCNRMDIEIRNSRSGRIPGKLKFKYKDRMHISLVVNAADIPLEEMIDWLSVLSGVRFYPLLPGKAGDVTVTQGAGRNTLHGFLEIILGMNNLTLDERWGIIRSK